MAQAAPQDAPWLARAADAFEMQWEIESRAQEQEGDDSAGKLALARSIGAPQAASDGAADSAEGGMRRLMSASLEAHLRKRYSSVHVAARVAQVDEVLAAARERHNQTAAQADALAHSLAGRLWLPPEVAAPLLQAKRHTVALLAALVVRLQETRAGFAALPVDALHGALHDAPHDAKRAPTPPEPVLLGA